MELYSIARPLAVKTVKKIKKIFYIFRINCYKNTNNKNLYLFLIL